MRLPRQPGLQFGTEDWMCRSNAVSFQLRYVRKPGQVSRHGIVANAPQIRSYVVCGFGLRATTDAIARDLSCKHLYQPASCVPFSVRAAAGFAISLAEIYSSALVQEIAATRRPNKRPSRSACSKWTPP